MTSEEEIPSYAQALKNEGGLHIDDVRQDLKQKALSSTYFMAKAVIGFKDLTMATHGPVCNVMESGSTRKLIVIPRDHLKTSICTIADTVRRIVKNPNIRILLGNETATNSSHFLRRIEAVFDNCKMFRWLFPEFLEEPNKRQKWSETEMLVPNRTTDNPESTVEAIGVGGAVVSRHFDIIKLDDLVGKEASESSEVMKKTIDWYIYTESLLVHPVESEIHVVGTRWAYHDVIKHILDQEGEDFEQLILSADQPAPGCDGQTLWPERFTRDALDRIKRKMGTWKYSCQYLNSPHDPEASSFDPKWLRYYDQHVDTLTHQGQTASINDMIKFIVVDPAISDDDQACNTAFVVTGVDKLERIWVLDVVAKRCQPFETIKKSFELYDRWNCVMLGVEAVAYQKALARFMEKEMEARGSYVNIRELKPESKKSKHTRIRGLQPYFENGKIFLKEDQTQLIEEYLAFPTGKLVDCMDALSYGEQIWYPPLDDKDEESLEEDHLMSLGLQGVDPYTGY